MNTQKITVRDASLKTEKTIEVALIGDIHIFDTPEEYKKISNMLKDIDKKNPDLVIFAGDYTGSPTSISNMKRHRLKIAKLLSKRDKQKKIFVLGNYESWSNPEAWLTAFRDEKSNILNNEIIQLLPETACYPIIKEKKNKNKEEKNNEMEEDSDDDVLQTTKGATQIDYTSDII